MKVTTGSGLSGSVSTSKKGRVECEGEVMARYEGLERGSEGGERKRDQEEGERDMEGKKEKGRREGIRIGSKLEEERE